MRVREGTLEPAALLFSLHIGIPYNLAPLRDFGLDESGKFLGGIASRYCSLSCELWLHIGHLEYFRDFPAQLEHNSLRHTRRSNESIPGIRFKARQTRLGNGWHIG